MKIKEQISKYNHEYSKRPHVIAWAKVRNARIQRKLVRKKYKKTEASKISNRKYRNKPEVKIRYQNYRLKVRYGISLKEYWDLVSAQNGVCAVCKTSGNKLHIDHSHKTGKVRGLLCGSCNRGIGLFKDSKSLLSKAIEYLEL